MDDKVYGINLDANDSVAYEMRIADNVMTGMDTGDFNQGDNWDYITYAGNQTDRFKDGTKTGITAATPGGQGDGALTYAINIVATVGTANDAVTLPPAVPGRRVLVVNDDSADALEVWPASGDDHGAGINTATTIASGSRKEWIAYDDTNWEQVP